MKIDIENYIIVPETERALLRALLEDIKQWSFPMTLEIHWQDYHDEYSPERTDPCPDFYGTYAIKWKDHDEYINKYMDIDTLDDHLCTVMTSLEQLSDIYDNETKAGS